MKRIDLKLKKHECEICVGRCGFGLTAGQLNILHNKRTNLNFNLKKHECEICGECFGQEGNLSHQHMDGVYCKEPHKCKQECGSSFKLYTWKQLIRNQKRKTSVKSVGNAALEWNEIFLYTWMV